MDRRNFLQLAALALAGKAAVRAFPFRVYSIPKEIVVAPPALPKELFEYIKALKAQWHLVTGVLEVYSPDFSIYRGSFRVAADGLSLAKEMPPGVMAGDRIVRPRGSDFDLTKLRPEECRQNDPRTGVFLNLARS